ncbi:MAG: ATP-binding protein [Methanopyraceae archaeon]
MTSLRRLLNLLRERLDGRRVHLMLSGGQDSAVAARVLRLAGLEVVAVHVTHRWTWPTPGLEARRMARRLGLRLRVIDVTDRLLERLPGAKGRSVCRICKHAMIEAVLEELGPEVLATGECGLDTIAGAVLDLARRTGEEPEFVQVPKRFFGGETLVVRPLIRLHERDVLRLAERLNVRVRRVGETGDLRRGRREGCPLQHLDPEVTVTEELLEEVWRVNLAALRAARRLGRRVAVKWPSFRLLLPGSGECERRLVAERAWGEAVRSGSSARLEKDT